MCSSWSRGGVAAFVCVEYNFRLVKGTGVRFLWLLTVGAGVECFLTGIVLLLKMFYFCLPLLMSNCSYVIFLCVSVFERNVFSYAFFKTCIVVYGGVGYVL